MRIDMAMSTAPTTDPTWIGPTKVCPKCGAQAQTVDKKCPHCGKKYKRKGGTFVKVMLGVVIGGLVLLVGCVALIAGGVNKANDDAKKTGITASQFDGIGTGVTQAAVESELGKPEDKQKFETKVPGIGGASSSCIYYRELGQGIGQGSTFQLCFDNGTLTTKNSYGSG